MPVVFKFAVVCALCIGVIALIGGLVSYFSKL